MERQRARLRFPVAWLLLLLTGLAACGGNSPPRLCLSMSASPSLNLYDGQAHAVAVYLYPVPASVDVASIEVPELLAGLAPPGVLDARVEVVLSPGQELKLDRQLPTDTGQVVVVADFYRRAGDPEGSRRAVVAPECRRLGKTALLLTERDLVVK